MRVTSRGLGRKELVMDFREYEVIRDGDDIIVRGTIYEPVNWDFSIRMCEDDLSGLIRVGLRRPTLALILRGLLRLPRWRRAHWSTDRASHVAQVKERRRVRSQEAEKVAPKPAARPAPKPEERPASPAAPRPEERPATSTVEKPVVGLAAQRARSAALRPVLGGARVNDETDETADTEDEPEVEGRAAGDAETAIGD